MTAFFKEFLYNNEIRSLKEIILIIFQSKWTSYEDLEKRLEWTLGLGYKLDIAEIGVSDVPKEFDFTKFIGENYDENSDISALVVVPSRELTLLLDIRLNTTGFWEEFENNNPFQLNSLELFDFEE